MIRRQCGADDFSFARSRSQTDRTKVEVKLGHWRTTAWDGLFSSSRSLCSVRRCPSSPLPTSTNALPLLPLAGLFTVRKAFLLSALIVPLLLATSYAIYRSGMTYGPLARFVNLSQACEIAHGGAGDIVKLRRGHPVTRSQTHLNRGRYKHSGEGVYVVGKVSERARRRRNWRCGTGD